MATEARAQRPPLVVIRDGAKDTGKFAAGPGAAAADQEVVVKEPLSAVDLRFDATPLVPVLDAAYGPSWRARDAVVFHCADGYKSLVKVQRILRYQPLLAHRRRDQPRFEVRNQDGHTVPLGALLSGLGQPEGPGAPGDRGEGAGPTRWRRWSRWTSPPRSPPPSRPPPPPPTPSGGYERFKTHCVACHSVNGVGGRVGPELNFPTSVTEYVRPEWLRRWLLDPTSVRARTAMPGAAAAAPAAGEDRGRDRGLPDLHAGPEDHPGGLAC
jgi:mono/diheme cytochrome c family protein